MAMHPGTLAVLVLACAASGTRVSIALAPLSGIDYLQSSDDTVSKHAAAIFKDLKVRAEVLRKSPLTNGFVERIIFDSSTLSEAVTAVLVEKLRGVLPEGSIEALAFQEEITTLLATPGLLRCLVSDLYKILDADPAANGMLEPLLFFKGFHGLSLHRVAHALWLRNEPADRHAALRLQSHVSELFGIDIHPGAEIGPGVMIDHATGVVIGSTAVLGSDIYMLHQVTLGATGKPMHGAKRHPTISDGVVLGAGSSVLGDITIGKGATVGANAVVTHPLEEGCTVVGVNKIIPKKDTR